MIKVHSEPGAWWVSQTLGLWLIVGREQSRVSEVGSLEAEPEMGVLVRLMEGAFQGEGE